MVSELGCKRLLLSVRNTVAWSLRFSRKRVKWVVRVHACHIREVRPPVVPSAIRNRQQHGQYES